MNKPIKLGKGKDSRLVSVLGGMRPDEDDQYPDLHIDNHDDPRLLDMPDEGEAKIKYKVKHREHKEHDEGGKKKHKYSVSLKVHHIEPPEKKSKKGSDSLDGARKSAKDYFDNLK